MRYYYGIDMYYIILVLPAIVIALIARINISATFSKYSQIASGRGFTAADAANAVLRMNGVYNVRIERVSGHLTDHYDPRTNVIRLSDSVYGSNSIASLGVAAHEAGHAVQHARGYLPLKIRNAILPAANIGSYASVPLIVIGFALNFSNLILLGIICMSAAVLFQLITLPVEFNASRNAIEALDEGNFLYDEEIPGAKKVLRAAAFTYVAALITALAQLLRFILIFSGRARRR